MTKYYDEWAAKYAVGVVALAEVSVTGNKDCGRVDVTFATPCGNASACISFLEGNTDLHISEFDRNNFSCIDGYEDVLIEIAKSYI